MSDRLIDAYRDPDDSAVEGALRPTRLAEFVGQERVKSQLGLVLDSDPRRVTKTGSAQAGDPTGDPAAPSSEPEKE